MARSSSSSGGEPRPPRLRFNRDAWQELNGAQLVFLAAATITGVLGFFYAALLILAIVMPQSRSLPEHTIFGAFAFPIATMVFAVVAGASSRRKDARRAALVEAVPALIAASVALLAAFAAAVVMK